MKKVIIIGHKSPDTDSVVSAFALTELIKKRPSLFPWLSGFNPEPARAGILNKETKFVFQNFKVTPPSLKKNIRKKNVFFVDHNENGQSPDGWEEANILGFMDHHSLGIKTSSPIFCHVEPVGSTATIIAKMFIKEGLPLNKNIAGLLLSAILSDTLKFTSPTATKEDKKIAKLLEKISRSDIENLTKKMFQAKSDIKGISVPQLVSQDYKEFKAGKMNFGISVWETTDPSQIEEKKKQIFSALRNLKKEKKLDLMFFALVDILEKKSKIFVLGKEEKLVLESAFRKKIDNDLLSLPGVVSRKKQMVPPIREVIEKL